MDAMKEEFQVYFLDLQMPNLDGPELAKAIRRYDDRSTIIFVTSYDFPAKINVLPVPISEIQNILTNVKLALD